MVEAKRSRSCSTDLSTSSSETSTASTVDLDAGVVRDLDLGTDVDLGGEGQQLVVLQLGDVHLGLAERVQLALVDRLGVELRQRVVDGLLQHRTAAEPLVDHAGRDLALAEARAP